MSGMLHCARVGLVGLATWILVGCGSSPLNHPPVEDRAAVGSATPKVVTAVKPPPGFENAGKPGYYTVKPGDTLIRIGLESGQSHKDLSRWNGLDNPNRIEVGQVLRVIPPSAEAGAVAKPVSSGVVTTSAIAAAPAPAKAASAPVPAASAPVKAATAPAAVASADDDMGWIWPGKGNVIGEFDEVKNKGVDISGTAGDPVLAVADGKVVYAGTDLAPYGKLIILKHKNDFVTAYAHSQNILVKEDQVVKKGQKIAEMGSTGQTDRVKLHFEMRKQGGKPVDPLRYLPAK